MLREEIFAVRSKRFENSPQQRRKSNDYLDEAVLNGRVTRRTLMG